MAMVASRMRLRRSRCASEPSSDSASTATFMTSRGCESGTRLEFVFAVDICRGAPLPGGSIADDTQAGCEFPTSVPPGTATCPGPFSPNGVRLDGRSLALLEHVLVADIEDAEGSHVGAIVPEEKVAARELVRDRARNSGSGQGGTKAIRLMEQGAADAWQPVFAGLAELGLFGVAVADDSGGAGGSVEVLCVMVEEAAKALVPGPVATPPLASLVVDDPDRLAPLAGGEGFAGP